MIHIFYYVQFHFNFAEILMMTLRINKNMMILQNNNG